MPKSLAAGHTKLILCDNTLMAAAADLEALSIATDLATMTDISCRIASSDFVLGPTGSNTVTDSALCDTAAVQVPTTSQFSGNNITPFRYFDETGKAETGAGGDAGDAAFQAVKVKGATLWLLRRDTSKLSTEDLASGDEYRLFKCTCDDYQQTPQDGYIKHPTPLFIEEMYTGVIAAAA